MPYIALFPSPDGADTATVTQYFRLAPPKEGFRVCTGWENAKVYAVSINGVWHEVLPDASAEWRALNE